MTDENETETETSEDERPESVGESLRAVYEELEADAAETDAETTGSERQAEEQSPNVSEAARTLAKSRKRKRREVYVPGTQQSFPETGQPQAPEGAPSPEEQPAAPQRRLEPPQGWPVPDKEAFLQLDDTSKHRALEFWGAMERKFTQGSQELARGRQRYQQLDELMEFYRPRWNLHGMTDQQVAAELFATHDLFTRDPLEAAHRLLANTGITPEQIAAYRGQGAAQGQYAPQEQPQAYPVDPRVDEIYNWLEQSRVSEEQQHLHAGVSQVEAVRSERTPDGRYLYPELWNDAYLLERVQPLVSSVLQSNPQVSLGEATKRAVHTLRMLDGTPSQNGSGLSAQEVARVRTASMSVRGRGNANIPNAGKAQSGEKMRDSLEAVWQQLSNSH